MDWTEKHKQVITSFLKYLNETSCKHILKGGTALYMCYNLDRFSEDIDLDYLPDENIKSDETIISICNKFCSKAGYECRVAKNTDTVKRCMIHYDANKLLKVEVSYRSSFISESQYTVIDDILVYTIAKMASLKTAAFQARNKIRDIWDISFIVCNYFEMLSDTIRDSIRTAFIYKGLDYVDYIIDNQSDQLIDSGLLVDKYLEASSILGIIT